MVGSRGVFHMVSMIGVLISGWQGRSGAGRRSENGVDGEVRATGVRWTVQCDWRPKFGSHNRM